MQCTIRSAFVKDKVKNIKFYLSTMLLSQNMCWYNEGRLKSQDYGISHGYYTNVSNLDNK